MDDDSDAAESIKLLMIIMGYHAEWFTTFTAAHAALGHVNPCIAILDYHVNPGMKICVVSGDARVVQSAFELQLRPDEILLKPVELFPY